MIAAELPRSTHRGWQETVAIVLLLVGGFIFVFGWLVGVVLLWLSDVWTLRDKLLGTLVVPGGLALPAYLALGFGLSSSTTDCVGQVGGAMTCTTSGGIAGWEQTLIVLAIAAAAVATVAVAVHLARSSRVAG